MSEELTTEQLDAVSKAAYKAENYSTDKDTDYFIVPRITMNDGTTLAQIRARAGGLYKNVQREPFIRKTGYFDSDSKITDIDITALVYYGTLEQAKIAPTLENVDIKVYYRDATTSRIKTDSGVSADTYVWRELPSGFHIYNNDTLYGYEWVVLQSDYAGTDGIYNLHMDIGDGLGVCKLAVNQPPIPLHGIQYKIVVTAKNLWTREFSLQDSIPLITSLADTDTLAPSAAAVLRYYKNAVETAKVVTSTLNAGSGDFVVDDNGNIKISGKVILSDMSEDLYSYITGTTTDLSDHIATTVDNAATDGAVHGIKNTGFTGNIQAHSLDGAVLSNGAQGVTADVTSGSYIPFVDQDDIIGLGTKLNYYERASGQNPDLWATDEFYVGLSKAKHTRTIYDTDVTSFTDILLFGSTSVSYTITQNSDDTGITVKLIAGNTGERAVTLQTDTLKALTSLAVGSQSLTASDIQQLLGKSSIAYKNIISELIGLDIKDLTLDGVNYNILTPNVSVDSRGTTVGDIDTALVNNSKLSVTTTANAVAKLGSALQALYELPLSTYDYKENSGDYKEQLGILVERVNQFRDHLLDLRGSSGVEATESTIEVNGEITTTTVKTGETEYGYPTDDNYLVHKRNTKLASAHEHVKDKDNGTTGTAYQNRVNVNAYTYTNEEVASIVAYLDLLTNKKELSQEIRNTVGILLKAAKETQERLLDVETAIYGFDADTLPGSDEGKNNWITNRVDSQLRDVLDSTPLLLGLNRIVKAVSLELFGTTDIEKLDAELQSVITDSEDNTEAKATVKTRMDTIDEITELLYSQCSAIVSYVYEQTKNDELAHTYADLFDSTGAQLITEASAQEEDSTLLTSSADGKLYDANRAWKNLPAPMSSDDLTTAKSNVAFGAVASTAHNNVPTTDECGVVRVPILVKDAGTNSVMEGKLSESHEDVDEDGTTHSRDWEMLLIDDTGTSSQEVSTSDTYKPIFKSKGVAWDSAKLERVNNKLSEVTKAVYGTDDVITNYPNRIETIRRNITNLVDDLYPNRSFSVERSVYVSGESELYEPFKSGKETLTDLDTLATARTDVTSASHTSIIDWINKELFDFQVTNFYINKTLSTSDYGPSASDNKQITLGTDQIIFSTDNLTSEAIVPSSLTSLGTYGKAFSRLDLLESIVGPEYCYFSDLFVTDSQQIYTKFLNDSGNWETSSSTSVSLEDALTSVVPVGNSTEEIGELRSVDSRYANEYETLTTERNSLSDQQVNLNVTLQTLSEEVAAATTAKTTADTNVTTYSSSLATLDSTIETDTKNVSSAQSAVYSAKDAVSNAQTALNTANKNLAIAQVAETNVSNMRAAYKADQASNLASLYLAKLFSRWGTILSQRTTTGAISYNTYEAASDSEASGIGTYAALYSGSSNAKNKYEEYYERTNSLFSSLDTYTPNFNFNVATVSRALEGWSIGNIENLGTETINYKLAIQDSELYIDKSFNLYNISSPTAKTLSVTQASLTYADSSKTVQSNSCQETITFGTFYGFVDETTEFRTYTSTAKVRNDSTITSTAREITYTANDYGKTITVTTWDYTYTYSTWTSCKPNEESTKTTATYSAGTTEYYNAFYAMTGHTVNGYITLPVLENTVSYDIVFVTANDYNSSKGTVVQVTAGSNLYGTAIVDSCSVSNDISTILSNLQSRWAYIAANICNMDDSTAISTNLEAKAIALYPTVSPSAEDCQAIVTSCTTNLNNAKATLTTAQATLSTYQNTLTTDQQKRITVYSSYLQAKVVAADAENTLLEVQTQQTKANTDMDAVTTRQTYVNERLLEITTARTELAKQIEALSADKYGVPYEDELSTELWDTQISSSSRDYATDISDELKESTNNGYVLSRKLKTLQTRLSTVESFADAISKYIVFTTDVDSASALTDLTTLQPKNMRFEVAAISEPLKKLAVLAAHKYEANRIFDLDLSESVSGAETHNKLIWQLVAFSDDVKKTEYTVSSSGDKGYTITGKLGVNSWALPYSLADTETDVKAGDTITVYVRYVSEYPSEPDSRTIYILDKTPTTAYGVYADSSSSESSEFLTGANGWENQSEYNIYKTINNLFSSLLNKGKEAISASTMNTKAGYKNDLYKQLMLLAHPIGSIYQSVNSTDPSTLFGGTWNQLTGNYPVGVAGTEDTLISSSSCSPRDSSVFTTKLSSKNIESHTHSYDFLTASVATGIYLSKATTGGYNVLTGSVASGTSSTPETTSINTGAYGSTSTEESEFIPKYYGFYTWVRIS